MDDSEFTQARDIVADVILGYEEATTWGEDVDQGELPGEDGELLVIATTTNEISEHNYNESEWITEI